MHVCLYSVAILNFMYFANATGGIHGYFYYFNFAVNGNNCQIKGLQET